MSYHPLIPGTWTAHPISPHEAARGRGGAGPGPTEGHGKSGGEKSPSGKNPSPQGKPIQPKPPPR
jgi:hypothetical protein